MRSFPTIHFTILYNICAVIVSALPPVPFSSPSKAEADPVSSLVSQNQPNPPPPVKINLEIIDSTDASSADDAERQPVTVPLELSAALPPTSRLRKPAVFDTGSLPSSSGLFYYGWSPLGQSSDVLKATIVEGPEDVKCTLYNYLLGSDYSGYEKIILTFDNPLDFGERPFEGVSAIDCVAGRDADLRRESGEKEAD